MDKMITNLNIKNLFSKENKIEWFGQGEWVDEPDCVTFEYKKYKCLIFRVVKEETCNEYCFGGHLCGYVLLTIDHKLYGACLSEINCHGGLTFSECDADFPEYDGKGLEGERSGLFFEILRLAKEIKPSFIFLENVPAIRSRGGLQVVREIAEMGYDCRWCVISAASVGAKHKRERWFLLGHSKSKRQTRGLPLGEEKAVTMSKQSIKYEEWHKEPEDKLAMVGVADGIQYRVDRIKCLGNAVVPAQAKKAFEILMGIKKAP